MPGRLYSLVLIASAAATSLAQEPVLPRPKPEPIKPTGADSGPVRPAGPQVKDDAIPGLDDADFRVAAAALRSEGTFLVELRGSLLKLSTGERIVAFYTDASGRRERPMVLIPCQKLQQMEQMAKDRPDVATFVLTGQVFVYLNVNYFLPTAARVVSGSASEAASEGEKTAPTTGDPAVQELIKQLEAQRETPRGPESTPPAAAKPEPTTGLLPEGQAVVRRRGRLVRTTGGDWALTFDSGTAGETRTDRPMTIIPSLNLQRMEAWAMQHGDATTFEVSGRTLAYESRNYLIPTLFQVYPATGLEARH